MIYNLSQKLSEKKPSYLISKRYIEALLDTVDLHLFKVPIYAVKKVKVALNIAFALNDTELIDKTKATIISLESLIAVDDKPALWGFSFDLLISRKNKVLTKSEEDRIVQDLEARLLAVMMNDSRAAELIVQRLSIYYHKKQQPDDVQRTLDCLRTSFGNAMKNLPAIQKAHYIERLIELYKQLNLHREVQKGLVSLREISKETDGEMKSLSSSVDISKDKIDEYVDQILQGDAETVFARIVVSNIPKVEKAKSEISKMAKIAPMSFLIPKGLMDKEGRKVTTVGSLDEDPEGHLVIQVSQSITFGALILHFIFEEAIRREIFTTYEIMKFLKKSCLIDEERYFILEKGIEAYLSKDYLTSIHLLIPQFEQAIRKLVEINGGNVLVIKDEGYNLITFEKVLNDKVVVEAVGEDAALYYKVLFTDKRGWNLRNSVAHGIHEASKFNKQTNDRLIHAVLSLGLIRFKKVAL